MWQYSIPVRDLIPLAIPPEEALFNDVILINEDWSVEITKLGEHFYPASNAWVRTMERFTLYANGISSSDSNLLLDDPLRTCYVFPWNFSPWRRGTQFMLTKGLDLALPTFTFFLRDTRTVALPMHGSCAMDLYLLYAIPRSNALMVLVKFLDKVAPKDVVHYVLVIVDKILHLNMPEKIAGQVPRLI